MTGTPNSLLRPLSATLLVLLAVAAGWYIGSRAGGDDAPSPADAAATDLQSVFADIAGRIVQIEPDHGIVTIDHDEINGFMAAMVMDFHVADRRELVGLEPGDNIHFDLVQLDGRYRIVRLRQTSPRGGAAAPDAPPAAQPRPDPLDRGDLLPDLTLFDARGNSFRLRERQAKHRLITFFYARCPLDRFCPAQSRRLAQLQDKIRAGGNDLHLVSLTLDADHDRPDVLAGYAQRFGVDPARWTLAGSDDAEAIRDFADRIGARIRRHDHTFQIDHALVAVRVDGNRIVDYVYGLDAMERLIDGM